MMPTTAQPWLTTRANRVSDILAPLSKPLKIELEDFYTETLRHEKLNGNADLAEDIAFLLLGEEIERRHDRAKVSAGVPPEQTGLLTLLDQTIKGVRANISWPWSVLSSTARALLPGTITVLSGIGGSSKSLLVSEACLHWLAEGVPFAVFHLEEDSEYHQLRALAQLENRSVLTADDWVRDNPDVVLDAHDRQRRNIAELSRCITDAPAADVSMKDLEKWVEARVNEGKRILVIDPVTAADSGDKPWKADKDFVNHSKTILRSAGASLIVVTHPRDGNAKGGTRIDNHAGGQAYNRLTQTVLALEACPPKRVETIAITAAGTIKEWKEINRIVRIHKARNGSGTGWSVGYWFDSTSLRFVECGLFIQKKGKS